MIVQENEVRVNFLTAGVRYLEMDAVSGVIGKTA